MDCGIQFSLAYKQLRAVIAFERFIKIKPSRLPHTSLTFLKANPSTEYGADEETALANLASRVESEIHRAHGKVEQVYKDAIRSKVSNLKDKHNPLRVRVISGVIAPQDFARMVS
ncbi:hypothetical protein BC936DRAFT_139230 [Jimgerdemannia flammicorona]|uniref:TFIIS central domain-containing protein n=1 Tax=Jimgerdemannia flammicorona TaxID=994334 RepID=A0A433BAC7_9FUNG|nr:hypothetical protein BC936DRAFT_139230 [Jimgerdemannia flammicorona]